MIDTIVRRATAVDAAAILALLERSGLPTEGFEEHIATAIVACCGGAVVGSAALEVYDGGALLRSVAVDSEQQRHGLGERLTREALQHARAGGVSSVYLLTTTARPFFARLGFDVIERHEVPESVRQSVEFMSVCPATATVMRNRL